jgi:lipopolysaccharide export system protein LptA
VVSVLAPVISAKKYAAKMAFRLGSDGNAFSNISFRTNDSHGRKVTLTSDRVSENKKDNFIFENTTLTFTMANGENGRICADVTRTARADRTVCELVGNVELKTDGGLLIKTAQSLVDFDKKIVVGATNIVISKKELKASSRKYSFDMNRNILRLNDNARGSVGTDQVTANEMVIHFDNMNEKSAKYIEAIGDASYVSAAYDLKADGAIKFHGDRISADNRVALFYKRNGKDYLVKSDHMRATLDKKGTVNNVEAIGSLIIKAKDATIRAENGVFSNEKIVARGNVVISSRHGDVFGDVAVLDINTGNVTMDNFSGVVADGRRNQ